MRVVIVEDEPLLIIRIKRFVEAILGQDLTKVSTFNNLDDAEEHLVENEVDVLLLDLNLQGHDGFELLKNQVAKAFHTVVISAYGEKALEAFDYGVLDFIEKPCSQQRLEKAFRRITDNTLRTHYGCRYLSVKSNHELDLIAVNDVTHIQATGHYTHLFLKDANTPRLHSKSVEKIMAILPQQFERVHRSHIVNMNYVSSLTVEPGGRYAAKLINDALIPIGRTKYQTLKGRLENGSLKTDV